MKKINKKQKIIFVVLFLPLLFISQYYIFKYGIISPMVKGANIKIIEGAYIQDIDKYVIKLGDTVVLSAGNYIKVPKYAKDPNIKFRILDDSKKIKLKDNSNNEKNTVVLKSLKTGYTSIAIMKNSRVLQKATILVVDPNIEDLNLDIEGKLAYVGDTATLNSYVEVDYKEFNNTYNVEYESSNENILKIENNKVKAVGVGKATIYAKSKDRVEAIRFNIVAKVKAIEIKKSFDITIGEAIKLNPTVITEPINLIYPKVIYRFSEAKLPIERAITFEEDGTVVGIRKGTEKVTISCGKGKNKRIEIVTINVKEGSLNHINIRNLYVDYILKDDKLNIALTWDILNGATNYDIFIRDNTSNGKFEIYKSITQQTFLKNPKIMISLDIDKEKAEINYDIYVVGRNEEGISKPSNIQNINKLLIENESEKNEENDKNDKNNNQNNNENNDKESEEENKNN